MNQLTRRTAHRSPVALGLLAVAVLGVPVGASAQEGPNAAGGWRVEPAVGIWRQGDRGSSTGRRVGQFVGLQVSRQRGWATRLTASAGYHRLDDAFKLTTFGPTGQSRTDVYDAELLSVTAGAAGDVWQGSAAAVSLGVEAGAGWNRDRFTRSTGTANPGPFSQPPTIDAWEPVFLAAPSLAVRRAVGLRLELAATGRILLGFGDITPSTVPTLAAGVAYRF
jgi:hypothetical protein